MEITEAMKIGIIGKGVVGTAVFDISNRILCLPIYPDLRLEQVDKIIDIIEN